MNESIVEEVTTADQTADKPTVFLTTVVLARAGFTARGINALLGVQPQKLKEPLLIVLANRLVNVAANDAPPPADYLPHGGDRHFFPQLRDRVFHELRREVPRGKQIDPYAVLDDLEREILDYKRQQDNVSKS